MKKIPKTKNLFFRKEQKVAWALLQQLMYYTWDKIVFSTLRQLNWQKFEVARDFRIVYHIVKQHRGKLITSNTQKWHLALSWNFCPLLWIVALLKKIVNKPAKACYHISGWKVKLQLCALDKQIVEPLQLKQLMLLALLKLNIGPKWRQKANANKLTDSPAAVLFC